MPLDDVISETTDLDALQAAQEQQKLRAEMASPRQPNPRASIGPVVQFEKSDIQFWLDVATLVLLFLIFQRL